MAENDFDDLDALDDLGDDSDLNLGDDLGDIMGDGLDDSDSSGDNNELDSFFEDLSTIDELDDDGKEDDDSGLGDLGDLGSDDEEEPPKKKEEKEEKEEKTKATPKKTKKTLVYVLLALIIAGVGYAGYWFMTRDTIDDLAKKNQKQIDKIDKNAKEKQAINLANKTNEKETTKLLNNINTNKKSTKTKKSTQVKKTVKVQKVTEPIKPKFTIGGKYLVQVATCTFSKCINTYIENLRSKGYPVYKNSSYQQLEYIKVISRQVYNRVDVENRLQKINKNNKLPGFASIVTQSNGYRITMGSYSALDKAKEVKYHLEHLFPSGGLVFNLEHQVQKGSGPTKVFAGPYDSRQSATIVMNDLKKHGIFGGSFVTHRR